MPNSALVKTVYSRASVCRSTCATLNYISAKGAVWTKEVMAKVDAFMENQVDASK